MDRHAGGEKFKNFSERFVEFMRVCQKHRMFSEATLKLSHVMSYRTRDDGRGNDYDTRPPEYRPPVKFRDQRPFRSDDKLINRSPVFVAKNSLHGSEKGGYCVHKWGRVPIRREYP